MNPNFETIGTTLVQQYYAIFDQGPEARPQLGNFYSETNSLFTFEGDQHMGREKIVEKLKSMSFQKIAHNANRVDCQPMFDGGVIAMVLGQLKTDDDPPLTFNQTFILKPAPGGSFFIEHDIFRLSLIS